MTRARLPRLVRAERIGRLNAGQTNYWCLGAAFSYAHHIFPHNLYNSWTAGYRQMSHWGPSYSFLFQIPWPPCGNALAVAVFIFRVGAVPLADAGLEKKESFSAREVTFTFPFLLLW